MPGIVTCVSKRLSTPKDTYRLMPEPMWLQLLMNSTSDMLVSARHEGPVMSPDPPTTNVDTRCRTA